MNSANDAAVTSVINDLQADSSAEYLRKLVISLGTLIKADYVFVSRLLESKKESQIVAITHKGTAVDNFHYALENTPCQNAVYKSWYLCPANVVSEFPLDQLLVDMRIEGYVGAGLTNTKGEFIGLLVGLFEKPMKDVALVEDVFKHFIVRASFGLERLDYETELNFKIAELVEKNRNLEISQRVYDYAAEGILITDKDKRIIYVNKKFESISCYSAAELIGKNPNILKSGLQPDEVYEKMYRQLQHKGLWIGELSNRAKNGQIYIVESTISAVKNDRDQIINFLAIQKDITREKEADLLINYQATHDLLTGLINRVEFSRILDEKVSEFNRKSLQGMLILIDLDDFKGVNQYVGHEIADQILKDVAYRLSHFAGDSAVLARLSGDEFAILMDFNGEQDATVKIKMIMALIEQPFCYFGHDPVSLTASIGVSVFPDDSMNSDDVYAYARQALIGSKRDTVGSFAFFDTSLKGKYIRERKIKAKLKKAIFDRKIEPFFQPIIDIKSHSISHCEALARWYDDDLGNVFPDEFIPAAELQGHIVALGSLMAEKSFEFISKFNSEQKTALGLTLNMSVEEFTKDSYLLIPKLATRYHVPSELIALELTENLVITDPVGTRKKLLDLSSDGFKSVLDDFGTGYSSLSYLKDLPFDILKIDKSFIFELTSNNSSLVLVKTIIEMAHNFNIKVVAEGVETEEHLRILKQLNCDYAQGYYFSKPLCAADFIDYFNATQHADFS